MSKEDDDLSDEERKALRDKEWKERSRKKSSKVDSTDDRDGYSSNKWNRKNFQGKDKI